jgi:hypothetical protein
MHVKRYVHISSKNLAGGKPVKALEHQINWERKHVLALGLLCNHTFPVCVCNSCHTRSVKQSAVSQLSLELNFRRDSKARASWVGRRNMPQ